MAEALRAAEAGVAAGQTPFGAVIVRGGEVLASAHNQVHGDVDVTAHAEIVALRRACRRIGGIDLAGATVYSTCEPCPMCFAACHWARVERVVFGATIADSRAVGFDELALSDAVMAALGGSTIAISPGVLRGRAVALMQRWAARASGPTGG